MACGGGNPHIVFAYADVDSNYSGACREIDRRCTILRISGNFPAPVQFGVRADGNNAESAADFCRKSTYDADSRNNPLIA